MAPTKVRMVLVEGESADGVTVDQDNFEVDPSPATSPNQVLSAILGTREGAAEGGYQLLSTGVTWTDHVEAALLRDALISHKVENVMLVSASWPRPRWLRRSATPPTMRRPRCSSSSPTPRPWLWWTPPTDRSPRCTGGFSP